MASVDDYSSTGAWMVASVIEGHKRAYEIADPIPTDAEICDAIDGANAGSSLGEFINAAWESAEEIAYDMFPQFREPDGDEEEDE